MTTFTKTIVYVYDALCPWCYAFTPVVRGLHAYYGDHFDYEVLSGGMYRADRTKTVVGEEEAARLRDAYGPIEEMTGTPFGEPFFEAIAREGRLMNSERPAIALAAFRMLRAEGIAGGEGAETPDVAETSEGTGTHSERAVLGSGAERVETASSVVSELDFAHTMLQLIFYGGADPNDTRFYKSLAAELGLDPEALVTAMESDEATDGAIYDFSLARQLGANSFPRLYLQTAEDYLHIIAKGYAPFEQVHAVIEKIELTT